MPLFCIDEEENCDIILSVGSGLYFLLILTQLRRGEKKNCDFSFKALLISLCLLVFVSCKSGITNEEILHSSLDGVSDTELVTPYIDMSILENTRSATVSDPDVVNWKVARFFAVVKKIEFEDHYEAWEGAKVSEKPIVIYNPNDNKPIYYKFRVIKDGKELGSITCNATKESSNPVAYISEMTSKVTAKVAKELVRDELKLVAVNYPGKFVVGQNNIIRTKDVGNLENTEFKDAITSEKLDIGNVFVPIKAKEVFENPTDDILKELEIIGTDRLELLAKIDKEEEAKEFWEAIDEEKILATTDEEIDISLHDPEESSGRNINTRHVYAKEEMWRREKILNKWACKSHWRPEKEFLFIITCMS